MKGFKTQKQQQKKKTSKGSSEAKYYQQNKRKTKAGSKTNPKYIKNVRCTDKNKLNYPKGSETTVKIKKIQGYCAPQGVINNRTKGEH